MTKKGWGRYGDEHEECGEGGKEGCSAWLWLLEVVRVYQQGAVYTALPKSTTDARDAWDHRHSHSFVSLQHPLWDCV